MKIFCCPGNGGISADAECVAINAMDIEGVVNFSKENQIDLVVVAPDDPLAAGMVDALNAEGIMTFGPTKAAAQIEASKVFAKDLMKQHNIPTASYEVFDDPAKALSYTSRKTSTRLSSRPMAWRWARASSSPPTTTRPKRA